MRRARRPDWSSVVTRLTGEIEQKRAEVERGTTIRARVDAHRKLMDLERKLRIAQKAAELSRPSD
jgi:hypothetical protein